MIRYVLSCVALLLLVIGGFFLLWFICTRFVWQPGDPLYIFLKFMEMLSPLLIILTLIGGVLILTFAAIRRPLRYLDSMIDAAKSLSHPEDHPIKLPSELNDVENELNLARERALRNADIANETVKRKNELIMYLAHDLKTPLASVIGYLTLLRDERQIPEELQKKYLSISLDKAQRLEDLINEFFEIARFNLSDISLSRSRINLTRLLEQVIFEFNPLLKEKNLICRLDAKENIMLKCDADKLQRVFDNLLRNAVLYSYENSEIQVRVEEFEGGVNVFFKNSGDTVPKEKLKRLFEQFYRLDAARSTQTGGAGLGLAIAKQIVELHGGKISAASQNQWIEFQVTLPHL